MSHYIVAVSCPIDGAIAEGYSSYRDHAGNYEFTAELAHAGCWYCFEIAERIARWWSVRGWAAEVQSVSRVK